jgi:hypothetical protein
MKAFLFTCAVLVGIAETGTHAYAQNYPWCAYLSAMGGATNCGFTTFPAVYDLCQRKPWFLRARNTQYVPPPGGRYRQRYK